LLYLCTQDVGDFWGSNVPANLRASVTELQTAYDTTFKARLAALKTAITVFTTADKPAMDAHCTVLEQAQSHLWAMQDDLTAVQDSLTGIPDWSSTT
jgi:chromosome condensin MukBEF complex kleisin-like MukF subunit